MVKVGMDQDPIQASTAYQLPPAKAPHGAIHPPKAAKRQRHCIE